MFKQNKKQKLFYFELIFAFLGGALLLCGFSTVQKLASGFPLKLNGYYVPFLFGGFVGAIIFILQKKRFAAVQKYEEVFKQSQFPLILFDHHKKIIKSNQASRDLLKYSPENILGLSIDVLGISLTKFYSLLAATTTKEVEITKSDKTSFFAELRVNKIVIPGGNHYLVMLKDLTEIKMYQGMVINNEKLDAIELFIKGIAHDFSNIIQLSYSNIQIIEDLLERQSIDSNTLEEIRCDLKECLDTQKDATKMLKILRKIDQPYHSEPEWVNMAEITSNISHFCTRHPGIKLDLKMNVASPQAFCDPLQIKQVLVNLLVNAAEAMNNNGKIKVSIDNFREKFEINEGICIKIEDNGCGIKQENLSRIFEPKFTTKEHGQGMGLFNCHKIIKHHNGEIFVKSEYGIGTKILVYLPNPEYGNLKVPEAELVTLK